MMYTIKLFYVSPYKISGTPPPLPFRTTPFLPEHSLPKKQAIPSEHKQLSIDGTDANSKWQWSPDMLFSVFF
jgi:hypothetical protein